MIVLTQGIARNGACPQADNSVDITARTRILLQPAADDAADDDDSDAINPSPDIFITIIHDLLFLPISTTESRVS